MFAAAIIFSAFDAAACNNLEPSHSGKVRIDSTRASIEVASSSADRSTYSVDGLSFLWPVRGPVIFNCWQRNNYINIAVPEGTPIRASESGVVAYAGNELRPFGNVVVLRHADGYVSAYAHMSEILVKRGDAAIRGDIIGKSGQSDLVSTPELHFEIRKNAILVDAAYYLSRRPTE